MTAYCCSMLTFAFLLFGSGCADDMPIVARYEPAGCPTFPTPPAVQAARLPDEPSPQPQVASPPPDDLIELNTATAAQLTELPGIGPALAARILAYREKRAFNATRELRRVRGIGPATYAKIKAKVRVQKVTP